MNLKEAFETGHLELLNDWEVLTYDEFLRWLRARADQFERVCQEDNYQSRLELGDWLDCLTG